MKTIKQTVTFKSAPHDVYELLMDSKKQTAFSGEKALISRKAGGSFKSYGPYISGKNILLVPDRKIVQSWHASNWSKGQDSIVTYEFKRVKGGTELAFTHEGVPDAEFVALKKGWTLYFWNPMKVWLLENL